MKHYSYLPIAIIFLFAQSCQENNGPLEYDLVNLGATIKLPNNYRLVNKERLDRVLAKKEDEQFKNELLAMIHKKRNIELLVDT